VRAAVAAVLDEAERHLPPVDCAAGEGDAHLAAHGRLDEATARAVAVRGLAEVVLPCARALLDRCVAQPELKAADRSGRGVEHRARV
jgi:hypothetical protein